MQQPRVPPSDLLFDQAVFVALIFLAAIAAAVTLRLIWSMVVIHQVRKWLLVLLPVIPVAAAVLTAVTFFGLSLGGRPWRMVSEVTAPWAFALWLIAAIWAARSSRWYVALAHRRHHE